MAGWHSWLLKTKGTFVEMLWHISEATKSDKESTTCDKQLIEYPPIFCLINSTPVHEINPEVNKKLPEESDLCPCFLSCRSRPVLLG